MQRKEGGLAPWQGRAGGDKEGSGGHVRRVKDGKLNCTVRMRGSVLSQAGKRLDLGGSDRRVDVLAMIAVARLRITRLFAGSTGLSVVGQWRGRAATSTGIVARLTAVTGGTRAVGCHVRRHSGRTTTGLARESQRRCGQKAEDALQQEWHRRPQWLVARPHVGLRVHGRTWHAHGQVQIGEKIMATLRPDATGHLQQSVDGHLAHDAKPPAVTACHHHVQITPRLHEEVLAVHGPT